MLYVPTEKRALLDFALKTIEQCRVSQGNRAAYCRQMNQIAETGRYDNTKPLINMLNVLLTKYAAHLYSPVELKFNVDFENLYPKIEMQRAAVVANILTRQWERGGTANLFGRGVYESLKYGWTGMKQWPQIEGEGEHERITYHNKLVMPWQFGVYNEAENDINRQPALCETTLMTMPEIWRRICIQPDAKKLYERIEAQSQTGASMSEMTSYFHQIVSSNQLNTSGTPNTQPGGVVDLGNATNAGVMGPVVSAPVVQVHELWVLDEKDYTTILLVG